jgi:small-conductance mechanosensitive channel
MLMIAQPLRIGDQVTIEDDTGLIEDVRLNYTELLALLRALRSEGLLGQPSEP